MALIFIIKLIISISLLRPFTILIHELGHGIPALILTKGKVNLYIGSYGDSKNNFRLTLSRLDVFFKKDNPLYWKVGLCKTNDSDIPIFKQFIIVLFGPIASLMLAIFIVYIIFNTNVPDDLIIILFVFMISSLYDFFINIVPSRESITLDNGSITHNDGQQLKLLFNYRTFYTDYKIAVDYYNNKDFVKASTYFKKIIESNIDYDYVYRLAISSFIQTTDYETAELLNTAFEAKHKKIFNSNDFTNSGLIKSRLENHQEAIIDYTKSLEIDSNNTYSLNNRGYTYNLIGEYERAILDFNKAIKLEPNFAYAFNNLGLAKIKLGDIEDGLKNIEKSMNLDPNNSYAYMNLGIYHFDKKNYKEALVNYNKALELDKETFLIDKRIKEVKLKLGLV
ncbi:tetratricopeptide repeat protein [Tenacibaculum ovolyticum]|uniref:tetratricopeptide repeat protein n=1 Tax=Tenacibaculum ovolyticum TaxID=104270 RepID=UPI0007ED9FBD|nr:tetratricopeptide repeat protein [Tenacibaculum ovolyticum]